MPRLGVRSPLSPPFPIFLHPIPSHFSPISYLNSPLQVCESPEIPIVSQQWCGEKCGKGRGRNMTVLSAARVNAIDTAGRYGDGGGLYLNVSRSVSKSWVQRITIEGRRRDIGLGSYPAVSLAQARSLSAANRAAVAEGRDSPSRSPTSERCRIRKCPPRWQP